MLHTRSRLIGYAAVLSLALSALSPAHAEQAVKPANALDGRELECVAALFLFESFLAEQIKKKGPTTPEGLDYTRVAKTNAAALGWYLGRVSSMPADRVGKSAFVEANAKVRGMEAEKMLVFIQDCTQNYQENAGEAFGAWLG